MTLAERPVQVTLTCLHDARGVCWLCDDQDGRWAEWRVRAGLSAEPPNAVRYTIAEPVAVVPPVPPPAPAPPKPRRGRQPGGKPLRTLDAVEEAQWVTTATYGPFYPTAPAPEPIPEPVGDDVYAYWDDHPEMTFREAELRVKRLKRVNA